jgi:hypothetical protein
MRHLVSSFLSANSNLKLDSIDVQESIASEAASLEEYQERIILKEREEARKLIIAVTPLVLQLELQVVVLDLRHPVSSACYFPGRSRYSDVWGRGEERDAETVGILEHEGKLPDCLG